MLLLHSTLCPIPLVSQCFCLDEALVAQTVKWREEGKKQKPHKITQDRGETKHPCVRQAENEEAEAASLMVLTVFLISPHQTFHREQARIPNSVHPHQVCHLESTVCQLHSKSGETKRICENKVCMDLPVSTGASENEYVKGWNVPETGGKSSDEGLLQKNCVDNKINYIILNFAHKSIFIK